MSELAGGSRAAIAVHPDRRPAEAAVWTLTDVFEADGLPLAWAVSNKGLTDKASKWTLSVPSSNRQGCIHGAATVGGRRARVSANRGRCSTRAEPLKPSVGTKFHGQRFARRLRLARQPVGVRFEMHVHQPGFP